MSNPDIWARITDAMQQYQQQQEHQEPMLLAQNSIPAGMQKQYIDNVLYGDPKKSAPVQEQGQRPKGQVGQTEIDAARFKGIVDMLKLRGMSEEDARAKAIIMLREQGLMR